MYPVHRESLQVQLAQPLEHVFLRTTVSRVKSRRRVITLTRTDSACDASYQLHELTPLFNTTAHSKQTRL
jgi:hypothetical protein